MHFIQLKNREAERKLEINFDGHILKHNFHPKYLRMILKRSLNYKKQVESLVSKLRSRTILIIKLAGTYWGIKDDILRTSTLALLYNTMNYSSPIWFNSVHSNKVDVHLYISLIFIYLKNP